MSIIRETPIRKTVFKSNRTVNLNDFKTLIVNKDFYSTLGEDLIIVKDVTQSKIKLDSTTTNRIKIKTLTNCVIIPDIGRIDEDWDEISIVLNYKTSMVFGMCFRLMVLKWINKC